MTTTTKKKKLTQQNEDHDEDSDAIPSLQTEHTYMLMETQLLCNFAV